MKKFTHAGYEIKVSDTGQFVAKTPHGAVTRPTLSALRQHLDDVTPFKPFKAFIWGFLGGATVRTRYGFKTVEIIGTERSRNTYGPRVYWRDSDFRKHHEVLQDTPANRKLAKVWRRAAASAEKKRRREEKLVKKAHAAVVKLIP